MSVATALAPEVFIPERARPARPTAPARPDATVRTLYPPAPAAPPVRLTRRGVVVLAGLVALLAGLVVGLAALATPNAPATRPAPAPAVVTVRAGDTLWAIASRVAPGTDPRAEVVELQRLNGLSGVGLRPGQQLRTR